jgi:hypothetical protein
MYVKYLLEALETGSRSARCKSPHDGTPTRSLGHTLKLYIIVVYGMHFIVMSMRCLSCGPGPGNPVTWDRTARRLMHAHGNLGAMLGTGRDSGVTSRHGTSGIFLPYTLLAIYFTTIKSRIFRTFASVNRREPVRIWCEYANTSYYLR